MNRRHQMPFGAEILQSGQVRFRLWAPAAREVALCLEGADDAILPMAALPGGWFEIATGRAGPGSRYRFRIDGDIRVPDPASRFNPADVHGASEVIHPAEFDWRDGAWRGRPWEEAVFYELHVGAFSPSGTFAEVTERLDYLADLGITAVELMPVGDFPGARNWGYDGVLPFAPDHSYGRPEALKELVQSAHARGLMVFLDVVYNHFGPEGNYLHRYAPPFFSARHRTPWGPAINYDGPDSRTVRDFFIHNALYWLEEYHLDGLRLDAVHAIFDDSRPDILEELAAAVRNGPGRQREVHLVLENDCNAAHYLARGTGYDAQWNDDFHHVLHTLVSGEADGYYADYADRPLRHLARCLEEGFAYQGEVSRYRDGAARGEPSRALPPTAFVAFLQTHDQVGNRAWGERLTALAPPQALRAAVAVMLLAPSPPLLFMGEEFGAASPFQFFCDFGGELAAAVTEGRRREFAHFARFGDPAARADIPDPNAPATFLRSRLDWDSLARPEQHEWLHFYHHLLAIRLREIVPRLAGIEAGQARTAPLGERALQAGWRLGDGSRLTLLANLGASPVAGAARPAGVPLFAGAGDLEPELAKGVLPAWSAAWFLEGDGVL
ncbi:MAG: malto-oligosyltrehalose trehalohydrolase [Sulfuricella sp.]|nr:malto-oligosyltrehalose trehalohydrolase [Sulfuricella sp.]